MKIGVAVVLLAALLCNSAQAQVSTDNTARALTEGCRAYVRAESGQDEPPGMSQGEVLLSIAMAGNCIGYIEGIVAGYAFAKTEDKASTRAFCIPDGVSKSQVARVLIRRIEEAPELEHTDRLPFVVGTLASVWPCR